MQQNSRVTMKPILLLRSLKMRITNDIFGAWQFIFFNFIATKKNKQTHNIYDSFAKSIELDNLTCIA